MSLWRELFDPDAPETRGERWQAFVFEAVAVAFAIGFCWSWVPHMRHQIFVVRPLGAARHIDIQWLFDPRWAVLNAAVLSALALIALGTRWKALYLAVVVCLHLQYVARFSLGKAQHGSNFVGLALFAWGIAALAFEARLVPRAARGLALFFFGVGYSCAAVCKLVGSGPRWIDGRHLWLWLSERQLDALAEHGSSQLSGFQSWLTHSRALATCVLLLGLLTEMSAWLMWWSKPRPYILFGLVGMHIGIQLALDISFIANVALLLTLAVPIASWVDRAQAWRSGSHWLRRTGDKGVRDPEQQSHERLLP